jgi:tRNA dimethylallyltransferase
MMAADLDWASTLQKFSRVKSSMGIPSNSIMEHSANILTNKLTTEQMGGVKHRFMDFVPPTERYEVFKFKDAAIPIVPPSAFAFADRGQVEGIHKAGDCPILVGGSITGFTKALIFDLLDETENSFLQHPIFQSSAAERWEFLHKVDPVTASRIPPTDGKNISRRLGLYFKMGRDH